MRAIDSSGNVDASPASRAFSVDATAPRTSIASGPAKWIRKKKATFRFFASEAGASFECTLDGSAWSACSSPKTYSRLKDRKHSFGVRAIDQVGNIDATPSSRSFTVDTRKPNTKIVKHPKKLVRTKAKRAKVKFRFRATQKGSRFSCKLDKGEWRKCGASRTYEVKLGKHTFRVRAIDRAGNADRSPARWVWKVRRR